MTGRVLDFDPARGYGWLIGRDAQVYFCHATQVETGPLAVGDAVAFRCGMAERGRRAFAVRRLRGPEAS